MGEDPCLAMWLTFALSGAPPRSKPNARCLSARPLSNALLERNTLEARVIRSQLMFLLFHFSNAN